MARDMDRSRELATKGEVADIAIDTMLALHTLVSVIQQLRDDPEADISEGLETVSRMASSIDAKFDDLTGWTLE